MGILANTVSICQFHVIGEPPEAELFDWAAGQLGRKAFRPIDREAEELSEGWVRLDDFTATDFPSAEACRRDDYLVFSFRQDRRRVPAALLKNRLEQAQDEYLAAHPGLQRVPRQQKEELRDAVRGELLARTLPAPAVYDVVWDTRSGRVTFTGLGAKVIDAFTELFKQTFDGLRLVPVHPLSRAAQVVSSDLQEPLQQANQTHSEDVIDLIRENRWLGGDFLTWLMYQTLEGASEYTVDQPGPAGEGEAFTAYLDDRLVLCGESDSGAQKITVSGPQDRFSEVRTALAGGKRLAEAVLHLEQGEKAWKLTLKGEEFHFGSFRSPAVKPETDARTDPQAEEQAVFFERMHVLEGGLQLFDSLLAAFLAERLGSQWPERERQILGWLEGE